MSKDLEKEYKELAASETPDLWARIEAGLDTKKSSRKHIPYAAWAAAAAACLCVAVIVPFQTRNALSGGSGMDMAAAPEYAAEGIDASGMDRDGADARYCFAATVEILEADVRRNSGPVYTARVLDTDNAELRIDSEIQIYAPADDREALLEERQTYVLNLLEEMLDEGMVYRIAE